MTTILQIRYGHSVPIEVLEPLVFLNGRQGIDTLMLLFFSLAIILFLHPFDIHHSLRPTGTERGLYKLSDDDLHASISSLQPHLFMAADSFTVKLLFRKNPNCLVKYALCLFAQPLQIWLLTLENDDYFRVLAYQILFKALWTKKPNVKETSCFCDCTQYGSLSISISLSDLF